MFKESCLLSEQISRLAYLFRGGYYSKLKWKEHPDYVPLDLDSMGILEPYCQPDKGSKNIPNTKHHPVYFI